MITKEEYEVILKIDNQGQRKAALSTVPDQVGPRWTKGRKNELMDEWRSELVE